MTARIHWARIALLGIAFVTFHAAEAQVANETIVVRTPLPQYPPDPLARETSVPGPVSVKTVPYVPAPPAPRPVEEPLPGQPLYKAPPPQSALEYALQPERITVPIVFVSAPVPLPKPKLFILPPELDSYPPDLMARARRMTVLPPVEYDKPYEGRLVVTRAESQDGVRELCSRAVFRGNALGCARRLEEGVCEIVLGSDKTIKAVGVIPAIVFRHEQGHCNGWGSDHKGARAIVIPRAQRQG